VAEERDDLEVAWARIVADYDRAVDDPVARWPIAEDVPEATVEPGPERTEPPGLLGQDLPSVDDLPDTSAGAPTDDSEGPEPEHHYVPPEPPPLGRPDLPSGIAWAGVLGGPVVLLLAAVLTWDLPGLLTAACVIGFVGGVVFLVTTMDDGRGRDGWDDGAQV
jgi:hypothetical protein